jgi:hypothetical protein
LARRIERPSWRPTRSASRRRGDSERKRRRGAGRRRTDVSPPPRSVCFIHVMFVIPYRNRDVCGNPSAYSYTWYCAWMGVLRGEGKPLVVIVFPPRVTSNQR